MPELASNALSQIYAIPAEDWAMINKRVGQVFVASSQQALIAQYLPAFPGLHSACDLWQQSTFNGLITQAGALSYCATRAIKNISFLDSLVKQYGNDADVDSVGLYDDTVSVLTLLSKDVNNFSADFNTLLGQVSDFLTANQVVDVQIAAHSDVLNEFLTPLGASSSALEQALGVVTGQWKALTDDLNNILAEPINITQSFIESLNMDAAIVCWQNVLAEAGAFPAVVAGQEQYWTNPS